LGLKMSETPRSNLRNALYTILSEAELGVEVLDRLPYEGAPQQSVVLTIVSGSSKKPMGKRIAADKSGAMLRFRVQIDVYHDVAATCESIAEKVEKAIFGNLATLKSTYGISDVNKIVDTDVGAPSGERESRILMDFECETELIVSD